MARSNQSHRYRCFKPFRGDGFFGQDSACVGAAGRAALRILRLPLDLGDVGKAHAVAISPDGSTVAVGGYSDAGSPSNHNIFLFDRASGELTKRLSGLPGAILHLAYSADGERLVASLEGNKGIQLFDVVHGYHWLPSDRQYRESSYWAAFDRAGRLVTTSDDGHVRLYAANDYSRPIKSARPR